MLCMFLTCHASGQTQVRSPVCALQEAVVDSLGISTVLEGCRQLTKVAFTQLDIAESVFDRMARQTTQLQVWV